jgi:MscS family membrane protein
MNATSRGFGLALLFATLLLAHSAAAQPAIKAITDEKPQASLIPPAEPKKPSAPAGPTDDFDRGVPRSSVQGFLDAADKRDWDRAAQYLDVRKLPHSLATHDAMELARQLSESLDRSLMINPETLSEDPKGVTDDELPSYRDFLGRIDTTEFQVDVLLQRVPRGDGVSIWKFSNATVAQIPRLYSQVGFGRLGERLVDFAPPGRLWGIPYWEWVGILLLLPASALIVWTLSALIGLILRSTGRPEIASIEQSFRGPIRLLLFCAVGRSSLVLIGPTVALRAFLEAHTVVLVAVAWLAMRTGDVLIDHAAKRLRGRGQAAAKMLGRPAQNFARGLVVFIAIVVWLDNLGIQVSTLVAGLGIGGLAVALAAQRPIEDMIGAFTIYATQPVGVGDFCRFGPNLGTVEEIGLRSTRVRTLDDSVVSVPNGEFSKLHLENFGVRRKFRFHPRIRLRYETTPDQLRCILVEIRKLFYSHPNVLSDPARVRFIGFAEASLDLEIAAYIDTQNYDEYLEVGEDLHLRIMDIVAEAGSSFAVPAQTTYLEPAPGLDAERVDAAEARVRAWRDQHELYLPAFPSEVIDELRGTVPYPPEGSPSAKKT